MAAHVGIDPCCCGILLHQLVYHRPLQGSASAADEDVIGVGAVELQQFPTQLPRNQHEASPAPLPTDRHLAAIPPDSQVALRQFKLLNYQFKIAITCDRTTVLKTTEFYSVGAESSKLINSHIFLLHFEL